LPAGARQRERCHARGAGSVLPGEATEGRDAMRVFVAGGSGAIGRRLVPQLLAAGHAVTATARTAGGAEGISVQGAEALRLDLLDAKAVRLAVAGAAPDSIVHEASVFSGIGDL